LVGPFDPQGLHPESLAVAFRGVNSRVSGYNATMITIKSGREIQLMRDTGKLAAKTLRFIEGKLRPGMSTAEVDKLAHDYMVARGAKPATLGYNGFPASCCTSRSATASPAKKTSSRTATSSTSTSPASSRASTATPIALS